MHLTQSNSNYGPSIHRLAAQNTEKCSQSATKIKICKGLIRVSGIALVVLLTFTSGIQAAAGKGKAYVEGSVWTIEYYKAKTGMLDDYLANLHSYYKKELDEAKKEKLILSYKIITSPAANVADWNVLIMLEFKNMASLDGLDDKWHAIVEKVIGDEEDKKQDALREGIRSFLGERLGREVLLSESAQN